MIPVNSSVIQFVVSYLDGEVPGKTGISIHLQNGQKHHVKDATKELLGDMMGAESVGAFFNNVIKPNFSVELEKDEWETCGIALEDIPAGSRLEKNKDGQVRALHLPNLK